MECPNCSTPHAEAARFCVRCGTALHRGINRDDYFVALPDEPVRVAALMSTLMPHLSGRRLYVYRDVIVLALLGCLVASAFGLLSVALVLAAVAIPAAVLTYIQDHGVWRGDPITSIGLGLLLSLVLGVCVGFVQRYFASYVLLSVPSGTMPSVRTILELGVLLPVLIYIAALVSPILVTSRARMRNGIDTVVICTLSGAAVSLGFSVMVQLGAFTEVTFVDPAPVAFIAVNLGLVQPIIFGTAAAVTVLAMRNSAASTVPGLLKGLALVIVYELGTTLLTSHGVRGIVLTTVLGIIVAAAGLVMARAELQVALLAEARQAVSGAAGLAHAPEADRHCAHCRASIQAGAAFCQSCGMATAALGASTTPKA